MKTEVGKGTPLFGSFTAIVSSWFSAEKPKVPTGDGEVRLGNALVVKMDHILSLNQQGVILDLKNPVASFIEKIIAIDMENSSG